ncbi:uncharacterized protein K460DRAFT_101907 [Cucurbitaria berberidis CBS 394.84]|uniref:F-box domain-containing protein n=1 Tax=Cucurbitaria berberidis CBS 394.84 TaxID=1168544 RepID=A0A9P4GFC6_9PLEO|nr:uncharacterized protein K460DRAFT_101907 [Cucurbitaria berberidis CBS 394.84]KAF1845023.1 hypothetical protein K460DRAFT_101907 [Cucurbitaria berberidis CBS 394.84]
MALSSPYLPLEVHRIISQYIHRFDLPNYRLASKGFAAIGAEELFRTITFHYSSASLARVTAIRESEHLQKQVQVLTWDTNLWKIPQVMDLHEWETYLLLKAEYFHLKSAGWTSEDTHATKLAQIVGSRQQWEQYLDNVQDEKRAKSYCASHEYLLGFDNVKKLCIVNGALVPGHRGLRKVGNNVLLAEDNPATLLRGEGLHRSGDHVSASARPSVHAFQVIPELSGLDLKKLRLDALCWRAFCRPMKSISALQNLTSLRLQLTVQSEGADPDTGHARQDICDGFLTEYLTNLPHLESLQLDLEGRICGDDNGYRAPSTIDDIFPPEHTWPKLRKLSLRYLDTTPGALLSLLRRHSSTLKILRLHSICLEMNLSDNNLYLNWPQVLQEISVTLHLERATLSGWLGFDQGGYEWNLGEKRTLAVAAATHLVAGGECPLHEGNAYFGRSNRSGA